MKKITVGNRSLDYIGLRGWHYSIKEKSQIFAGHYSKYSTLLPSILRQYRFINKAKVGSTISVSMWVVPYLLT